MKRLRTLWAFLKRENIHKILIVLLLLIVVSSVGLAYFEPDIHYKDALWWSFVTVTTVGYGDISPTTLGGRVIGVAIMLIGIGILGMFTATIASIFVENKIKTDKGMNSFDFTGHIILCEWNTRAREVIRELRSDSRSEHIPIVLIADVDNKPIDDADLYFIKGNVSEETLQRANLAKAATVVIMSDDRLDPVARDAKSVLSTLTVETLNPEVYSIVELEDEANVRHCRRAHADEIIVGAEFSTRLISRAAIDHGISKVMSELLSTQFGNDLYKIALPPAMAGKAFIEIFTEMKRNYQCTVLAVQRREENEVIANPPCEMVIDAEDALIVIAEHMPGQET